MTLGFSDRHADFELCIDETTLRDFIEQCFKDECSSDWTIDQIESIEYVDNELVVTGTAVD